MTFTSNFDRIMILQLPHAVLCFMPISVYKQAKTVQGFICCYFINSLSILI